MPETLLLLSSPLGSLLNEVIPQQEKVGGTVVNRRVAIEVTISSHQPHKLLRTGIIVAINHLARSHHTHSNELDVCYKKNVVTVDPVDK